MTAELSSKLKAGFYITLSVFVGLVSVFWFPVISLFLLFIMSLVYRDILGYRKFIFTALSVSSLFAVINILKLQESDLHAYIKYFYLLKDLSFFQASDFVFLNIRYTEVVFRMYVWLLSQIFTTAVAFVVLSTVIIYFSNIFFTLSFSRRVANNVKSEGWLFLLLSMVWCCFVGITFSLTGHVIRQYLGVSVFALGLLFLMQGRMYVGWLILLLSGLVHNALFLLVPIFIMSLLMSKYLKGLVVTISILLISYSLSGYVNLLGGLAPNILNRGEAENSGMMIILDVVLVVLFRIVYRKDMKKKEVAQFNAFVILYSSFLILFHGESLIFLRYYFIFDIIRSVIGVLLILKLNKDGVILISSPLILFSIGFFMFRYSNSPWDYGFNGVSIIVANLDQILGRVDLLY